MELEFNITNQSLKRIDNSQPADLSNEYLTCKFNFKSDDWSGFGKFAIFRVGEMSYRELIIEDECVVPFDVLKHNKFLLTVYGVKDDIRITTNYLWVHLNASAFVTDYDESSYFNPDMTEELLELVELKTDKSLFDETVTELESSIATKTDNTTFTDTVNDLENSIDTKTDKSLFDETVVELETGIAGKTIGIVKQAVADTDYFSTYVISQGGTPLYPKINIPKDYLLKSASLEQCTVKDEPIEGLNVGDWYFDWVLNTEDDTGGVKHLYLNANVLTDVYTGDNETIIIVDNVISVKPGVFAFKTHTHTKSEITDFAHNHTKSEITDFTHSHSKADITDFAHNHDERYYTEQEVNTIIENTKNELLNRIHINSTEDIIQTGDTVEIYGYAIKDGKPVLNKKIHFYEVK